MSSSSKKKKESGKKEKAGGGAGVNWPSPGSGVAAGGGLPEQTKSRLWELFGAIEREFEQLHADNAALRERLEKLELLMEKDRGSADNTADSANTPTAVGMETPQTTLPQKIMKIKNNTRGQTITQRLKTYTPSKKNRSSLTVETSQVCVFEGHRDGIWDVAHTRVGPPLVGAASADGVALMWDVETGHPVQKYVGHLGSVNGISFHPQDTLCCTVSGDCSAHVWKYSPGPLVRQRNSSSNPMDRSTTKHDSSGEERNLSDEDPSVDVPAVAMVKQPVRVLSEHRAPVLACDWLTDGRQLVTASWDHTAKLWDIESGHIIHSLEGHDQELTHVCAHPTQQLLVTSSVDTTFRLCDFRAPPINSVNVFQGHSKAVNSCAFSLRDNVISASDDHSLKIWDLRNMRSPLDSVRLDCGINRISVSHGNRSILAVPLDNRHLKLYDISGSRLAHLPRRQRQTHRRMVCSVTWSHDGHVTTERCNLFSAGFDNVVVGWRVKF